DLIGALAPLLGLAVDPLRSIAAAARLVHGASAGVVLTRAGQPLPLPGLPTAPLLAAGSAVLAAAARQLAGGGYAGFLWPAPGPLHVPHRQVSGPGGRWLTLPPGSTCPETPFRGSGAGADPSQGPVRAAIARPRAQSHARRAAISRWPAHVDAHGDCARAHHA